MKHAEPILRRRSSAQRWSALLLLAACTGCFMDGYGTYLRDAAADDASEDQQPPANTGIPQERDASAAEPDSAMAPVRDSGDELDARMNAPSDGGSVAADASAPRDDASSDAGGATGLDGGGDARVNDLSDAALDASSDASGNDASLDAAIAASCVGQASCTIGCTSSPCELDCADAGVCNATCRTGEACEVHCEDPTQCNVTCQPGATCDTFCRNIADCAVTCQPGAQCRNICTTGSNCGFTPACVDRGLLCNQRAGCGGRSCS